MILRFRSATDVKMPRARMTELWSHLVVATEPLLFDAECAELVAGVDAGNAADRHQDDHRVGEMPRIFELARDAGHIVVADERQR